MLALINRMAAASPALLSVMLLGPPAVTVLLWELALVGVLAPVVPAIATVGMLALLAPVALWLRGGMRHQRRAEVAARGRWAWPNVVDRPLAWALAGIIATGLTLSLPVLWVVGLVAGAELSLMIAITASAIAIQSAIMSAASRVTKRQIAAEEEFKRAAIAEFGEEAAAQFRTLEDGAVDEEG